MAFQADGANLYDAQNLFAYLRGRQIKNKAIKARLADPKSEEAYAEILSCKVEEVDPPTAILSEEEAEALTLKDRKTLKEVELLDLKIQQQKGELVSRSAMREAGQRVGALIVAELAAMANDAPGQLAGADEATIRERLEARHVVLVNRLRTAIGEIETVGIEQ
jgi:hypothetical protein